MALDRRGFEIREALHRLPPHPRRDQHIRLATRQKDRHAANRRREVPAGTEIFQSTALRTEREVAHQTDEAGQSAAVRFPEELGQETNGATLAETPEHDARGGDALVATSGDEGFEVGDGGEQARFVFFRRQFGPIRRKGRERRRRVPGRGHGVVVVRRVGQDPVHVWELVSGAELLCDA